MRRLVVCVDVDDEELHFFDAEASRSKRLPRTAEICPEPNRSPHRGQTDITEILSSGRYTIGSTQGS